MSTCILFSAFLAIRPDKLVLSAVSLHHNLPLANISANTPLFLFPLVIALGTLLHFHNKKALSPFGLFSSPWFPFLASSGAMILVESFYNSIGLGSNLKYGLSILWMCFASYVFLETVSVFEDLRLLVLRFVTYMVILIALGLLFIYFFSPDSVHRFFTPFEDIPLGFVHQQGFLMALGSFVIVYSNIPEFKNLKIKIILLLLFHSVIIINFSRGAMLTSVSLFIPLVLRYFKTSMLLLFLIVGTIFVTPSLNKRVVSYGSHISLNLFSIFKGKLNTGKDLSASVRLRSSMKAIESFISSPWIGVGSENIQRFYSATIGNNILTHTYWLIILAGYGIFVFLSLIYAFFSIAFFIGIKKAISWAFLFYTMGFLTFLPYFEDWFFLIAVIAILINEPEVKEKEKLNVI